MKETMNTIEQSLKSDDKLTARKLKAKLAKEFSTLLNVSLETIKCCQKELRWVCTHPYYYQLIREANKKKRNKLTVHYLKPGAHQLNYCNNLLITYTNDVIRKSHEQKLVTRKCIG